MTVSKRYSDLMAELITFADFVATNGLDWGFTADDQTEIAARTVSYAAAYNAYADEPSRTAVITAEMEQEWVAADILTRKHQQRLKHSGLTLTQAVIAAIGIPVNSPRRGVVDPPQFAPGMQIQALKHLISQINAYDPTPGAETRRGKPKDASSLAVWVHYADPGEPAPTFPDFTTIPDVGRSVFNIRHTLAQVGKVCHVITAYRNRRGVGPRSVPISFPVF